MALIPDDQRSQQRFLGIVVLVAAAGLFYMYVYSPRTAELTELEDRIDQVEQQNEMARARTGGLDRLREELERTERLFAGLQELVPSRAEATEIYESMATRSEELNLDLVSVRPLEPDTTEAGYYLRQQWDMTVEGDYHTLGRFLTMIGSLPRLVRPQVEQLQPVGGQGGSEGDVRANFTLETFVLAPDTARAARQGGGGSDAG